MYTVLIWVVLNLRSNYDFLIEFRSILITFEMQTNDEANGCVMYLHWQHQLQTYLKETHMNVIQVKVWKLSKWKCNRTSVHHYSETRKDADKINVFERISFFLIVYTCRKLSKSNKTPHFVWNVYFLHFVWYVIHDAC